MDSPLSQRPRLWMHRTRRFWFGLLALLFLTGFTLMMGYYSASVSHTTATPTPDGGQTIANQRLALEDGGLRVTWRHRRLPHRYGSWPPDAWDFGVKQSYGFQFWPELRRSLDRGSWYSTRNVTFIPVWPLIALLCVLWPFHLHRADLKETRRLTQASRSPG